MQESFGKQGIATIMVPAKPWVSAQAHPRLPPKQKRRARSLTSRADEDDRQARRVEKIPAGRRQNVSGQPFYLVKSSLTAWDGDRPPRRGKVDKRHLP